MKYRKKPIVVEAFQLTEETRRNNYDWPEWLHKAWQKERVELGSVCPWIPRSFEGPLEIHTLGDGYVKCEIGDYIVRGVKGELYPCKPDIFMMTHDLVQNEEPHRMCEGCGKPATTQDSEGVPLCKECFDSLVKDKKRKAV